MHNPTPIWRDLLWLTLSLCLLFGAFLGVRPLMVPDEGRYTEIPREMIESGDYLTPRLNYVKYFEKPPLFYWIEAVTMKVFGLNEWPLRGVVSVIGLLGCLMTYLAGLKLYDRRTGLLACLILATCALYFSITRFIITDMPLTVWMSCGLLLFMLGTQEIVVQKQRYYFWGMYVFAALAVLTKGLVGIVLPGLVIFLWLCLTNNWRQLKTYCLPSGLALFLLIAAPWHVLMQLKNPEFFHFYFIEQHFLRYLTDYAGREQPAWFFPAVTVGGFFPWVSFLLAFFFSPSRIAKEKKAQPSPILYDLTTFWRQRRAHAHTLFLLLWVVTMFVFYSLSKSQLLSYAPPLMPPLALLTAHYLSNHWRDTANLVIRNGFFLTACMGILISVWAIIALPHPIAAIVYAAITCFLVSTMSSAIVYWRKGMRAGMVTLMITIGVSFSVADVGYPHLDTRSIKTLALTLKPRLKPDSEVVSYHAYYQDLPPYLQRRVTVVGYTGELAFGVEHEDTRAWMMDDNAFWQRWRNKPGMFMMMALTNYADLKKQGLQPLYPISQTTRDILLTNTP